MAKPDNIFYRILDYIFYRMYKAYKKAGDPARFSSIIFISLILIFLFSIFPLLLVELLRVEDCSTSDTLIKCVFYSYFVLFFILTIRRYNSHHIKYLIFKFRNNRFNRKIPTWIIFVILPVSIVLFVFYCMAASSITKSCEGSLFYFLAGLF